MTRRLSFSIFDYVLFGLTLIISGAIGVYFSRSKQLEDYTRNKLPFLPTALSLMASFVSGVSLLGFPSEIYTMGTAMVWLTIGGCFSLFITAYVIMPPVHSVKGLSMYGYLEERFESKILRVFGSALFTLATLLWDAVALYAPSIALAGVSDVPSWTLTLSVGLVCTLYTSIGGLKAVVWTDAFQALLMYGGLLAVVVKGTLALGGVGQVFALNEEQGRLKGFLNIDPNPFQYMTVWTSFFGGVMIWIGHYGANQLAHQRYRSMELDVAKRVILMNVPIFLTIYFLVFSSALVMGAYYSHCDPLKAGEIANKDQITIYFMLDVFIGVFGLPGLVLACVCSATLSTVSSGIHSMASVALEDFVKPSFPALNDPKNDKKTLLLIKAIALFYGLAVTGLAFLAEPLGGVFAACVKALGALDGPLAGVLLLGILVPWANWIGALAGLIAGCFVTLFLLIGSLVNNVSYPTLPTRVDGCDNGTLNDTWSRNFTGASASSFSSIANSTEHHSYNEGVNILFILSYIIYPVVGAMFVLVIGSVLSAATGCSDVKTRNPKLLFWSSEVQKKQKKTKLKAKVTQTATL